MQLSERSFSGLKRLKTYMRSTMSDDRLLYLMMLHIHRDKCDEISVLDVANKFVGENDGRRKMFGTFTERDIIKRKAYRSIATQIQIDQPAKK